MRLAAAVAAGLALWPASCSYRVIDPAVGGGRSLAVPTAVNDTRWRGVEASLSSALRADAARLLDVRLVDDHADLVLRSEVSELYRGAPVRAQSGGALLGTTTLEVSWTLEDASGALIARGRQRHVLEFLPSEGEDPYTAMGEIVDFMAEAVVIEASTKLARTSSRSSND